MMLRRFLVFVLFAVLAINGSSSRAAAPVWADASTALIRPGVQISSSAGGCTSNFIFYEAVAGGNDIFIGLAAHCFSTGGPTDTNGCTTPSLPLGSTVRIPWASQPATLAYSSWLRMKQAPAETNGTVCQYNDFALAKLDPADHNKVNPSLRFFGGPTGMRTTTTSLGTSVYSYGNSSLRQGITQTSPKRGISEGTTGSGWSHGVYTVTPGIPGDSGSGFVDGTGKSMGVLVTLRVDGSNGVTDLNKVLTYLRAKWHPNVQLALGTEPFADPLV